MMKRILAASAALAATAAFGGLAHAGTDLSGTVVAACGATTAFPTALSLDTNGNIVNDNGLLDRSLINAKTVTGAYWCNGAGSTAQIVSTKGGIISGPNHGSSNFKDQISYVATVKGDGSGLNSTKFGTAIKTSDASATAEGLFDDVLTISFVFQDPGGKLVAGTYTDTLTFTLTPLV